MDLEHTLKRFFVLAGEAEKGKQEVLVKGSLWYKLRNGRKMYFDFASAITFADPGDGKDLQAEFYEVFVDSHELIIAIQEMNEAEN